MGSGGRNGVMTGKRKKGLLIGRGEKGLMVGWGVLFGADGQKGKNLLK